MGSEYFINNQVLEDKVRNLLPSQGGAGAGFDLSASTQIIPIIDLTESAEGSNIRQDLQSSLSHGSVTSFNVINTTSVLINNTGYWRLFGAMSTIDTPNAAKVNISVSDGFSSKIVLSGNLSFVNTSVGSLPVMPFDFLVYLPAGHTCSATSGSASLTVNGCSRQIADIDGKLTNP